jgi:hypothetical protein
VRRPWLALVLAVPVLCGLPFTGGAGVAVSAVAMVAVWAWSNGIVAP